MSSLHNFLQLHNYRQSGEKIALSNGATLTFYTTANDQRKEKPETVPGFNLNNSVLLGPDGAKQVANLDSQNIESAGRVNRTEFYVPIAYKLRDGVLIFKGEDA